MDDYGEKEAKRMRKDETLNGNLKSSRCAAASSDENTVSAGGGFAKGEDMEWQELNDSAKRKKKQSEDAGEEAECGGRAQLGEDGGRHWRDGLD